MKTTVLDFESYYDAEYSLRKMTPVEYILDPRFEAIGCAIHEIGGAPTYWVDGPDLPKWFDQADTDGMYLSHNWLFDGCLAAWRYGFVPRYMSCTLSISRALLGHQLRSVSLKSVTDHLGLGVKGDTVMKVLGMSLASIKQAGLYPEYVEYSKQDADLCAKLWTVLVRTGAFPVSELAVLDAVMRTAIRPRFRLDISTLAEHKNAVRVQKDMLLAESGLQRDHEGKVPALMSNDMFASLLERLGVDPPMKTSLITQKVTYAFAKTDPEFIELQEHDDPRVQALVAARLGHKSTLEETRTDRLINISNVMWPGEGQARYMPVPLKYSGAHTHRLSGDWKLNLQNLPTRGDSNALRRSLAAPPGETVVVVDASQIEARITAWLCGQTDMVEAFEVGRDIYSEFASEIFGYTVNRKLKTGDHAAHGFVGKTAILGLGYGVGWVKFQRTVKLDSKKFTGTQIVLDDVKAKGVVDTYRAKYAAISQTWRALNDIGIPILAGREGEFSLGPCTFEKGAIKLPSGLHLKYHGLNYQENGWVYTYGGKTKRLYGAALLENIVQALARIITMDAAVRLQKKLAPYDIYLNLQAHDELVYLAPDEAVEWLKSVLIEEMKRRPTWAPTLPLNCEVNTGDTYGDAK